MTKPEPETYVLTFTAAPDENAIPMQYRIRRLLKMALRTCRLKCTDISSNAREMEGADDGKAG